MSLFLLVCECGGAVGMAMKPLKRAGVENWADTPVYKGAKAKQIAKEMADLNPDDQMCQTLYNHIKDKGRFAVVVGTDTSRLAWTDVARGDSASMIEAQVLIESFA